MKVVTDQFELSPAMQEAVERLYSVFRLYKVPQHMLDVCLQCCMDPELEAQMRRLPLRDLTAKHFYEYNTSAMSDSQTAEEIKYLLPRLIELLAQGAQLHHSIEVALQRLGNCDPKAFSEKERAALDAFALCYFAEYLNQHLWLDGDGYSFDNAFSILLMFNSGGVAVEPLLDYWAANDCAAATLHYADASYFDFWREGKVGNAFADGRLDFCKTLQSWLMEPKNRETFANRILNFNVETLYRAGDIHRGCGMNSKDVLEAVFDAIVE